jgi:hypothetical protein
MVGVREHRLVTARVAIGPQRDAAAPAEACIEPAVQSNDLGDTTTVSPIERSRTSPAAVDGQPCADHVGATEVLGER